MTHHFTLVNVKCILVQQLKIHIGLKVIVGYISYSTLDLSMEIRIFEFNHHGMRHLFGKRASIIGSSRRYDNKFWWDNIEVRTKAGNNRKHIVSPITKLFSDIIYLFKSIYWFPDFAKKWNYSILQKICLTLVYFIYKLICYFCPVTSA